MQITRIGSNTSCVCLLEVGVPKRVIPLFGLRVKKFQPVMINDEGACTFLEVDGDIPYLIPDKVPSNEEVQLGEMD